MDKETSGHDPITPPPKRPLQIDPQNGKAPNAWSGAQRNPSSRERHHSHAGKMAVTEAYANDGSSTIYTVHLANLKVHGYAAMLQLRSCHVSNLLIPNLPARTAQGGGGSFKDRKPIGEVDCCDAWMAEQSHRWIERWLERRPIYLSIYLPV